MGKGAAPWADRRVRPQGQQSALRSRRCAKAAAQRRTRHAVPALCRAELACLRPQSAMLSRACKQRNHAPQRWSATASADEAWGGRRGARAVGDAPPAPEAFGRAVPAPDHPPMQPGTVPRPARNGSDHAGRLREARDCRREALAAQEQKACGVCVCRWVCGDTRGCVLSGIALCGVAAV